MQVNARLTGKHFSYSTGAAVYGITRIPPPRWVHIVGCSFIGGAMPEQVVGRKPSLACSYASERCVGEVCACVGADMTPKYTRSSTTVLRLMAMTQ